MVSHLLDTDVSIEIMRQRDPALLRRVHGEEDVAISMITEFELVRGAIKSPTPATARESVDLYLRTVDSLGFDRPAAEHAADIRVALETASTPIGPYDVLIAGHARSLNTILVTRNTKHFERVPGLRVEGW